MSLHARAVLAAESGTVEVEVSPAPDLELDSPEGLGEATSVLVDAIEGLLEGFLRSLPLIAIGLLILLVGVVLARPAPLLMVLAAILLALSVAGVPVGAPLAGVGIAGLAIAFALQSILENFVAGILLIIRKPMTHGEQVRIGEHDHHTRAASTTATQARCVEMGESSVNFELRYWTAPDIATVVDAHDRVLRSVKSALEGAGMQTPWPIRTLSFDNTLTHSAGNGDGP